MVALLLTACIAPNGQANPQRLHQYEDALTRWLHHKDSKITGLVFVDNSGHDLRDLERLAERENKHSRRVEFLQTDDNDIPEGLHYGYAELGIIDRAVQHSQVLRDDPVFVKITGRLYFPSVSRLLRRLPHDVLAAADGRANLRHGRAAIPFLTTTLLVLDRNFYEHHLMGRRSQMAPPEVAVAETLLMQILQPLAGPRVILRFPCNVSPHGISGDGVHYRHPRQVLQQGVRAVARRVAPALWV